MAKSCEKKDFCSFMTEAQIVRVIICEASLKISFIEDVLIHNMSKIINPMNIKSTSFVGPI